MRPGMRLAGVGRHMVQILDQICTQDRGDSFEIFISSEVELPDKWKAATWVTWHPMDVSSARKRVPFEHFGIGPKCQRLGCQVLFVLFNDVPAICPIPMVSVVHDAFPRTHGEWFPYRKRVILDQLTALACRKSDRVITVSEASKKALSEAYRVPVEKFVVAYNGPGNDLIQLTEQQLQELLPSVLKRYILTISTLEPRKNLKGLITGFEKVATAPEFHDLHLLIAGAKGWMESDLAHVVENSPVKDRIQFLGYVSDLELNAYLQKANLFALVSHVEGFGIPVLEAMTLGVPVVTSNTSSLPEVAGDCAFYCDPHQPNSIANALILGLTDRELAMQKATAGQDRANRFTWESAWETILNTLHSVR